MHGKVNKQSVCPSIVIQFLYLLREVSSIVLKMSSKLKSSNGFELSTMYRIRPKHDQLKWQVVLRNVGFGLVIEKSVAFPKCVKIVHVFVELVASSRIYTWGTWTLCVHFS